MRVALLALLLTVVGAVMFAGLAALLTYIFAHVAFTGASTGDIGRDIATIAVLLPLWWCAWAGACYMLARRALGMGMEVLIMCAGVPVTLFFVAGAVTTVLPESLWTAGVALLAYVCVWVGLRLAYVAGARQSTSPPDPHQGGR